MNYIVLIVTGVLFGFFAALPIGPVNLICIRRTLQFGSFHGFVSGLGAALGDTLFASITGFGFTALVQLIVGYSNLLQLIGGLLLLFFGVRTFYTPPPPSFEERLAMAENGVSMNGNRPPSRGMASTFVLAITNPVTLFGFTALFATLGGFAAGNPSFFAAAFVVLGVFAGSTLWWLTLTTVVGLLHARISDRTVRVINEISGAVVALFGVVVLGHLASKILGW
jgi:threonine/homoserine/homoserine lactone efflux protein